MSRKKLRLWSITPSGLVHAGKHKMNPEACIDFLGTLLCGDRSVGEGLGDEACLGH